MEVGGIFGLLVLIADVWAIHIFQSSADTLKQGPVDLLVLMLPVLGVIIWHLAGPRSS